ncbi:hypothetical protein [Microbacterium sp. SS28]|uniref:hypothetical protein n=1 Tax=Microbacterium sp. SS28 TaxID=2919948 RepID=UPI001FAAF8EA|nr:hypothetical protein [Microbacterium sp. SS28]
MADDESSDERRRRRAEEVRAYKAAYRRTHAAEIAEYRAKYRALHREQIAAQQHDYNARLQTERKAMRAQREAEEKREATRLERAEARRQKSRAEYAKDPQRVLDRQRKYRAKRRETDPEHYRAVKREALKRWRDNHREEQNAKDRERYRANAVERTARMRAYYAENSATVLKRKHEKWAKDPEASREQQRRYRAREAQRRRDGLPAWRLHRTTADEALANKQAADEFFHREFSAAQIARMSAGPPTPAEMLDAWERDCARARARSYYTIPPQDRANRLSDRLGADRIRDRLRRRLDAERDGVENERLDEIGRQINDRLRQFPRRSVTLRDPAAPLHIDGQGASTGLSR